MRSIILCIVLTFFAEVRVAAVEPIVVSTGTKVMPKLDAVVIVGSIAMDYTQFNSPWIIQKIWGNWLFVGDERKGWVQRNQVVTMEEAAAYYAKIIDGGNESAKIRSYKLRGVMWLVKGELDHALADYGEVLRVVPDPVAYHNRGNVWKEKKEYDKAIADYDQVIRLAPNVGTPYSSRGEVWSLKKQYDKAIADYDEAIRLDPARRSAYSRTAWLRATCPNEQFRDGAKAVALATKACGLTDWANPYDFDTLAAAYAESNDFDSAIRFENMAIEVNRADEAFVTAAHQRLALYQEHKPYRDE